jgi:hypothetical protein
MSSESYFLPDGSASPTISPMINTPYFTEDIIMDTTHKEQEAAAHQEPEAQRAVIRLALDEIAGEVRTALRDANLDFPIYLTVPHSGDPLVTITCPLDPSDEDWSDASVIVCRIIGKRLGTISLRARGLVCAIANETITAAEVTGDPIQPAS